MATEKTHNWFEQGGSSYARFRPEYPLELAEFLASISPNTNLAVDIGCGNGQLTSQLALYFDQVFGIDPSADQLAQAVANQRITYSCAPAENTQLTDHCADLITAAQAAHWFDLDRFYDEVRRIIVPGGIVSLSSYGVPQFDDDLSERFNQFYQLEIRPYWPKEREHVDTAYKDLPFPFQELSIPDLAIHKNWNLAEVLGYISTWSAVRKSFAAGRENILDKFATDLSLLWGDPLHRREVYWPINMRLGKI